MAIGLEQVQVQYQNVLDGYVSGKIDIDKMKELVQWETRWTWPFEQYQPIFETAKELGIRLVALNVDSEDLAVVERDGFPGLGRTQLQKYISDPYVLFSVLFVFRSEQYLTYCSDLSSFLQFWVRRVCKTHSVSHLYRLCDSPIV